MVRRFDSPTSVVRTMADMPRPEKADCSLQPRYGREAVGFRCRRPPRFWPLEMPGLRETNPYYCVGDDEGVSHSWVDGTGATCLCGKGPTRSRSECLPRH